MPEKFHEMWKEYDKLDSDELSEARKGLVMDRILALDDRQKILLQEMNNGMERIIKNEDSNVIDFEK